MKSASIIYNVNKGKCIAFAKLDKKEWLPIYADGQTSFLWNFETINTTLLNLQINLNNTEMQIAIFSDEDFNKDVFIPKLPHGFKWDINSIIESIEILGVSAKSWILNNKKFDLARMPKTSSDIKRYIFTYPNAEAPDLNPQYNTNISIVDYYHNQGQCRKS